MKKEIWILLAVIIAVSLIFGLSIGVVIGRVNSNKVDYQKEIQSFKDSVSQSALRVKEANKFFLEEMSALRNDITELSAIKSMSIKEANALHDRLEEQAKDRDSIKQNILLNW